MNEQRNEFQEMYRFPTSKNPIKFQRTFEICSHFMPHFYWSPGIAWNFPFVHQFINIKWCAHEIFLTYDVKWFLKQSRKKAHPAFNDNAWWCVKCDCYTSISIHQLHSYSVKRECLYNSSSISRRIRLVEVSSSVLNSITLFEMGQMSNASFFR